MTQHSAQDVARLQKTREQGNRIASANDRAVLALSSAGLAASFVFVRFLGGEAAGIGVLQAAWVCWFLSTACLVVSFQIGMLGSWMRERADRRGPSSTNTCIRWLNFGSGLFYLAGLFAFVVFLFLNTPHHGGEQVAQDEYPRSDESYGDAETRSELVYDLPEPEAEPAPPPEPDPPSGDDGGDSDSP